MEDLIRTLLTGAPHETPERDIRRDSETISSRCSSEGSQFLTKVLPLLGKALEEGLESGTLQRPRHFKSVSRRDNRPAFLQASFKRVFDSSGVLLPDPCPMAVKHIRQVCYVFYKYNLPSSPEQNEAAYAKFFQIEQELYLQDDFEDPITDASQYHLWDLLKGFDPSNIVPRHGPGAVATGEILWEKFEFKRLPQRITKLFNPMNYFMVGGFNELEDRFDWWTNLEKVDQTTSKVCLVPKDSRGPRLISSEPLEQMFIQQGLSIKLMEFIESHPRMGGMINFTSQDVNRRLSQQSSITAEFATIDLADASDRISLRLVEKIFGKTELYDYLLGVRSTHTLIKGLEIPLHKHAPMGSSLCFPVLSMSVWSLLCVGLSQKMKIPLRKAECLVYVYGDDIIVPSHMFEACAQILESVGLKVNLRKSFHKGFFRESCGMDAFKGVDVTPIRAKTVWTGKRSDGQAFVSFVALANNLRAKGYEDAFEYLVQVVEATYGYIPYVTPTSSAPGILVESLLEAIQRNLEKSLEMRFMPDLQIPVVRASFLRPRRIDDKLDSWPRLLRNLIIPSSEDPSVAVVPRSAKIKRGWARMA